MYTSGPTSTYLTIYVQQQHDYSYHKKRMRKFRHWPVPRPDAHSPKTVQKRRTSPPGRHLTLSRA